MSVTPFATGTKIGEGVSIDTDYLINCYAQVSETGRSIVSLITRPGLEPVKSYGGIPLRGIFSVGDSINGYTTFSVSYNSLASIGPSGTTILGQLNSNSGPVWMASNGLQLLITDGASGYIYDLGLETLVELGVAEGWALVTPTACTYLATYLIVMDGNGSYWISGNFDGMSWNAADVAFAEADPDGLSTIIANAGELYLFGSRTIEVHYNTGAADFPFAAKLGATQQWGTPAPFSVARLSGSLAFLGQSPQGGLRVFILDGYNPRRISDDGIEHTIAEYATVADARGFGADYAGHAFYFLTFPTADKTWVYDQLNDAWFECRSGGGRFLAEWASGRERETLVTDYRNGNIYRLADINADGELPIYIEARGRTFNENQEEFEHDNFEVVMENGTAPLGSNPQAMLTWSNDNARTWSSEYWRTSGKIGEYETRARWNRLGTARNRTYRIRITDPVPRKIIGIALNGDT